MAEVVGRLSENRRKKVLKSLDLRTFLQFIAEDCPPVIS